MRTRYFSARVTTFAACVALGASLAACTSTNGDPSPFPSVTASSPDLNPSRTPTPSVGPAVAQAEAAILEAYRGYWAAKVVSYADPTKEQDPNLARFADDTALADAQSTIFTLRSNGISIPGQPGLSPVVSEIQLGASATAKITDCVDATNWQPIYTATGKSAAAPGQPMRVITESTAFVAEGRWLIRTSLVHRDQTC
ncbi:MAG TPA: hypothetical protein VMV41_02540 [Cellulomonadaceae bacterium]|nr:hypothetical protein [Cellulomonadaceae bacterium]